MIEDALCVWDHLIYCMIDRRTLNLGVVLCGM
jgi:hypothetical protein